MRRETTHSLLKVVTEIAPILTRGVESVPNGGTGLSKIGLCRDELMGSIPGTNRGKDVHNGVGNGEPETARGEL